jgi:hypothetical protein
MSDKVLLAADDNGTHLSDLATYRPSDENVWSAARLQEGSWWRRLVCANVFGLWLEIRSPGHDEMRTCLSL